MRVLVTGAAGCLGRAVLARLAARGHEARGHDLAAAPPGAVATAGWVRGDLFAAGLDGAAATCDAVVHCAALVHRPDVRDPAAYERINVDGTRHVLDVARDAGVAPGRCVTASTVGVYGRDHDLDADEDSPVAPVTPYAASKLRAETLVRERGGVVLRFPVLYGPGDRGNVAQLMRAIARGRFVLPGPCDRPRSLGAAATAAEGLVLALERGAAGLFLITDDHDLTVSELAAGLAEALGARPPARVPYPPVWLAAALGSALAAAGLRAPLTLDALRKLTTRLTFSCARAKAMLGYRPVVAPRDGLRQAAAGAIAL